MTQLEKVLEGIRRHAHNVGCFFNDDESEYCPYWDEDNCANVLMQDTERLIKEYHSALKLMVYQYCTIDKQFFVDGTVRDVPDKEVFFNRHMSAGEEAFRVLGIENQQDVPEDWLEDN